MALMRSSPRAGMPGTAARPGVAFTSYAPVMSPGAAGAELSGLLRARCWRAWMLAASLRPALTWLVAANA